MSVRDLRRARGEATRSALLEAAIESVALHGLSGTTLSTVAEQAGVSRASVGFHFKGKDQLLSAALGQALERYEMTFRDALNRATTPRAKLEAILTHDVTFPIGFPSIIALWFAVWGEAQSLALYRAGTLPHDRKYTKEIHDLAAALTDDAPLVKQFTSAFTFYLAGIWLDYHLDLERYDADGKIATGQRLIAMLP
jgi:TetR/AcrR family transcriptional regulator, transcriptional repressor of bet genes